MRKRNLAKDRLLTSELQLGREGLVDVAQIGGWFTAQLTGFDHIKVAIGTPKGQEAIWRTSFSNRDLQQRIRLLTRRQRLRRLSRAKEKDVQLIRLSQFVVVELGVDRKHFAMDLDHFQTNEARPKRCNMDIHIPVQVDGRFELPEWCIIDVKARFKLALGHLAPISR